MRVTRTTPGGGDPVVVYEGEDVAAHVADAPARQAAARAEAAKTERALRRPTRRPLRSELSEEESDG